MVSRIAQVPLILFIILNASKFLQIFNLPFLYIFCFSFLVLSLPQNKPAISLQQYFSARYLLCLFGALKLAWQLECRASKLKTAKAGDEFLNFKNPQKTHYFNLYTAI